ncbi:hypothetical protein SAMD00023353_3101250 [Rosellinia necatrix]|uniref:Uncharacterized protein n=1 Tax=Rosellinia necatrix TaxID=77044 RepID=A0A1W2TSL1_ROSNE|nr:hypothetical protein SAMD00023353_3101250 [Rosellinia necatrix]
MKASLLGLAIMATPTALADFWLVYQRRSAQIGRVESTTYGTSIIHEAPRWTCERDMFRYRIFPDRRDVGEQNYGIQFEPWGNMPGPLWHDPLIDVTMNLDPSALGRQTISHDRDYIMTDATGEQSARCHLNRTFIIGLDCWFQHPDPKIKQFNVNVNGSSMFFCESDIEVNEDVDGWDMLSGHVSVNLLTGLPPVPTQSD